MNYRIFSAMNARQVSVFFFGYSAYLIALSSGVPNTLGLHLPLYPVDSVPLDLLRFLGYFVPFLPLAALLRWPGFSILALLILTLRTVWAASAYYAEFAILFPFQYFTTLLLFYHTRNKSPYEVAYLIGTVFLFAGLYKANADFLSGSQFLPGGDFWEMSGPFIRSLLNLIPDPEAFAYFAVFFEVGVAVLCFVFPRVGIICAASFLALISPRNNSQIVLLTLALPTVFYALPFLRLRAWNLLTRNRAFFAAIVLSFFALSFVLSPYELRVAYCLSVVGLIFATCLFDRRCLRAEKRFLWRLPLRAPQLPSVISLVYGALPLLFFVPVPLSYQVYIGKVEKERLKELVLEDPQICQKLEETLPIKISNRSILFEKGRPCRLWLPTEYMVKAARKKFR